MENRILELVVKLAADDKFFGQVKFLVVYTLLIPFFVIDWVIRKVVSYVRAKT